MREMVAPSTNVFLTRLFPDARAKRSLNPRLTRTLRVSTLVAFALSPSVAVAGVEVVAPKFLQVSSGKPQTSSSDTSGSEPTDGSKSTEAAQADHNDTPLTENATPESGTEPTKAPSADKPNTSETPTLVAPTAATPSEASDAAVTPQAAQSKDDSQDNSENSAAPAEETPEFQVTSPFNTMILVEGVAKYGLFGIGTDVLESDQSDPFDEKFSVGYFGAQATFGLMPANSAFTLAGRLRGGAYVGHSPAMGNMGAAMLFGANFARRPDGRSFSYAMGGLGVEFIPTSNDDLITIHASGGTVFNEFTLGAGLDFGINNELFIATFGLQIGWGRLL